MLNLDSGMHPTSTRQKLNSERSDGGYGHTELEMVPEHSERRESLESEDADDEQDLSKAALLIQGKYRERLQRKSRGSENEFGGEADGRRSGWNKYLLNFYIIVYIKFKWPLFICIL